MAQNNLAHFHRTCAMAHSDRAQAVYLQAARDFDDDDVVVLMIDLQEDNAGVVVEALRHGRASSGPDVDPDGRSAGRFLFGVANGIGEGDDTSRHPHGFMTRHPEKNLPTGPGIQRA